MSDDDLPPPPKRVVLDDSDDDLPPPPPAQKKVVIDLDDDEDDLPPPPPRPAAAPPLDDDFDDDLPPPPAPPPPAADDSEDDLPPPPAKAAPPPAAEDEDDLPPPPAAAPPQAAAPPPAAADQPPATKEAAAPATRVNRTERADTSRSRGATLRKHVASIQKEGYLWKQQPSWPYGKQKRFCILKGRMLSYYEREGMDRASGSLDLKGATLVDVTKEAKYPHSFGIGSVSGGSSGSGPSGGVSKGRTFIFACNNEEEYNGWLETIRAVLTEPRDTELHWFEKMAQGIF